jgi:hypothetical protein
MRLQKVQAGNVLFLPAVIKLLSTWKRDTLTQILYAKRGKGTTMTLTIDISPDEEATLEAKARAEGLSIAQFLLRQALGPKLFDLEKDHKPISEAIAEIMADVPPEELARLPQDGASQHDHYTYGWPKRNS